MLLKIKYLLLVTCWVHSCAGGYAYPKRLYSWNMFERALRECPTKFEAKRIRNPPDRTEPVLLGQASWLPKTAQIRRSEVAAWVVYGTSQATEILVLTHTIIF